MKAEVWFDEYVAPVYKYILMIVKDHSTAEDLTQDTFIKAFTNANQFKGHSEVKTWLLRIAHTTSMNNFRKKYPIGLFFDKPMQLKVWRIL